MSTNTTTFPTTLPPADSTGSVASPASASGRLSSDDATDFAQAIQITKPDQNILGQASKTAPDVNCTSQQHSVPLSESLREGPAFSTLSTKPADGQLRGDTLRADRTDRARLTSKTDKPDSRGDAILSTLGGVLPQTADSSPSMGSVTSAGQTSASGLAEISGMDQRVLTQLVDSILVSAQEGKQEVHIKVQDAVLKDTTIVVRMQDGQLEVQLHTTNTYSSQLLHQNVDTLRHALEGRQFGESVRVKVEDRATGQHADGQGAGHDAHRGQGEQQNQRSRGNFLWGKDEG